jgi:Methionyl-tRNA synthetase
MVSGTDCHGTPITVEADKRGVKPEDIVNEYTPKIHYLLKLYNLTFDIFTSTTTENHKKITQEFFLRLLKNGYIFKAKQPQYFFT